MDGNQGLIRQNSTLRTRKNKVLRESDEEELLPEALEADGDKLAVALQALESFRLKVINWLYPDE